MMRNIMILALLFFLSLTRKNINIIWMRVVAFIAQVMQDLGLVVMIF